MTGPRCPATGDGSWERSRWAAGTRPPRRPDRRPCPESGLGNSRGEECGSRLRHVGAQERVREAFDRLAEALR
ncbi:hypothetical protein F4560_001533 [Saccharothrix ecbatanensis]|uniref:Uncharacterized protein n=1 Tax=Saccharothrix ecbatanensis TaxID=1105145 RepID=A0A7W9HGH4_9PSEU|nr:hypothetical protein [Saccharothrix ecbatanensis]MBB5801765.1 hypothetical protein [Saccharothrix ecbatanensis]